MQREIQGKGRELAQEFATRAAGHDAERSLQLDRLYVQAGAELGRIKTWLRAAAAH